MFAVPDSNLPGIFATVFHTLTSQLPVDFAKETVAACTYLILATNNHALEAVADKEAALPACHAFATAFNSPAHIKNEAIFHTAFHAVLHVLFCHSSADQNKNVHIADHASPAGVSHNHTKVHSHTNVSTGCSIIVATPSSNHAAASITHAAGCTATSLTALSP